MAKEEQAAREISDCYSDPAIKTAVHDKNLHCPHCKTKTLYFTMDIPAMDGATHYCITCKFTWCIIRR